MSRHKYVTNEFVGNECKILDFGGTNIKKGGTYYELVDTNEKIKYDSYVRVLRRRRGLFCC